MIRLIKFLIFGTWHEHEYQIVKSGPYSINANPYGIYYDLQCKTCGRIKFVKP